MSCRGKDFSRALTRLFLFRPRRRPRTVHRLGYRGTIDKVHTILREDNSLASTVGTIQHHLNRYDVTRKKD